MTKPKQRYCLAITSIEFAGAVNIINVCGLPVLNKPFPTYIPLCAAHRTLAEVRDIKVFTEKIVANYRL